MTAFKARQWLGKYLAAKLASGWKYHQGWIDYRGYRCVWRPDGSCVVRKKC